MPDKKTPAKKTEASSKPAATAAKGGGATATEVKEAPAKAAPARKAPVKHEKGTPLECELCGMAVIVDELCDCVEVHEIFCCGEPMKPKAGAKARTATKAAAKPKAGKAKAS